MSRLLILLFLYFNYVFCVSYTDYSSSSSSEEITEPGSNRSKVCLIQFVTMDYPIVLEPNTSRVIYPDRYTEVLRVRDQVTVEFACPGHYNTVMVDEENTQKKIISATCDPDRLKSYKNFQWSEIRCNKSINAIARYTGKSCADNKGKSVSVHFDLGAQRPATDRTINVFAICFNKKTFLPIYTYNRVDRILRDWYVDVEPRIRKDKGYHPFFSDQIRSLYLRRNQRLSINRQLKIEQNSRAFVSDDHLHYLVAGCLVSANDYYFKPFRYSTYRYFNSVPQWRSVHYYNWKEIEKELSIYAIQSGNSLEIWTGVDGITTIETTNSTEGGELYLYGRHSEKIFPIPKLIWKIVYYRANQSAIVFITENNPFLENPQVICPDVTNSTNWLKFDDRRDIKYGYTYACEYGPFAEAIGVVPNITVTDVLVKDVEGDLMRRTGGPTKRVPYFQRTFNPDIEQSYLEFSEIPSHEDIEYILEPYRHLKDREDFKSAKSNY